MVKLKILHLGKYYPPEFGGIESVTQALAEDHSASGHDVEVNCFTARKLDNIQSGNLIIRRFQQFLILKSQPLGLCYFFSGIMRARKVDIVLLHTPNLLASLIVLAIPKRVKLVVLWHADIASKGLMGIIVRPLQSAMLRRANAVVCTSLPYAEAARDLDNFRDKVSIIPIGIAPDTDPKRDVDKPLKPYILFIGRLVPYKGLKVLLRARSLMQQDIPIKIIGVGPDLNALKAEAAFLNISDKISFLGRLEYKELNTLLKNATIFCLPSVNRLEAFGVVLLEAMREKIPVVSSDIVGSGVGWVNAAGCRFAVGDHEGLAKTLDLLIANPVNRTEIGAAGHRRFVDIFQRDSMSGAYLDLFHSLID